MPRDVATTILAQLGGNKFLTMTGAKDFVGGEATLTFKLPSGLAKDGINAVRITLDSDDTYTVELLRIARAPSRAVSTVAGFSGIYADGLRTLLADKTGLALELPRVVGINAPKPAAAERPPFVDTAMDRFDRARETSGPGNWSALTVLYASPDDKDTQAKLAAWLDKYADTGEEGMRLLDGRDNAGEAGIRPNDLEEIARRLRYKPAERWLGARPTTWRYKRPVTIYRLTDYAMGFTRTETNADGLVITSVPYAQYAYALRFQYTPKRARGPHDLTLTTDGILVVDGIGWPDQPNLVNLASSTPGVSVSRGKYRSDDPRWRTDLLAMLKAKGADVLVDYHGYNPNTGRVELPTTPAKTAAAPVIVELPKRAPGGRPVKGGSGRKALPSAPGAEYAPAAKPSPKSKGGPVADAAPAPGKKIALRITDPENDVPSKIVARGRACDGEVNLVLEPLTSTMLVAHLPRQKGKGAPSPLVATSSEGDAPREPKLAMTRPEAVRAIKEASKRKMTGEAPASLRGRWVGTLYCTGELEVVVVLRRKIATYATITITSNPASSSWSAVIARTETFFAPAAIEEVVGAPTLQICIAQAVSQLGGVIGPACTVKDTHRRSELDPAYAAKHPMKRSKAPKDPTVGLKEGHAPRAPKAEKPPKPAKEPKPPKPPKEPKVKAEKKKREPSPAAAAEKAGKAKREPSPARAAELAAAAEAAAPKPPKAKKEKAPPAPKPPRAPKAPKKGPPTPDATNGGESEEEKEKKVLEAMKRAMKEAMAEG